LPRQKKNQKNNQTRTPKRKSRLKRGVGKKTDGQALGRAGILSTRRYPATNCTQLTRTPGVGGAGRGRPQKKTAAIAKERRYEIGKGQKKSSAWLEHAIAKEKIPEPLPGSVSSLEGRKEEDSPPRDTVQRGGGHTLYVANPEDRGALSRYCLWGRLATKKKESGKQRCPRKKKVTERAD